MGKSTAVSNKQRKLETFSVESKPGEAQALAQWKAITRNEDLQELIDI
ncbi:MAG: hypothetical protein U9Q88_19050 [Bacillota bacterium]|nr:hypothetical protein [Bacillota bacterium]